MNSGAGRASSSDGWGEKGRISMAWHQGFPGAPRRVWGWLPCEWFAGNAAAECDDRKRLGMPEATASPPYPTDTNGPWNPQGTRERPPQANAPTGPLPRYSEGLADL